MPGCGTYLSCLNNPKYPKPPTNNTGWTDFVVTPLIGTAWVLGEDTIDKYIVRPIAVNHRIIGGRILRSALEPSRSFAAIFAGKFPWDLPSPESNFMVEPAVSFPEISRRPRTPSAGTLGNRSAVQQRQPSSAQQHLLRTSPAARTCRDWASTLTTTSRAESRFDSTLNFIPGQQGSKPMMEGLFGVRMGARYEHVGVFAKVRPGFIYYENAYPVQGATAQDSLTRFATDFGGIVEYYPDHNSTLRFDVGTTLVRYLTNHVDPNKYELGSLLSTQYIVTQGNFQVSTSYTYRF